MTTKKERDDSITILKRDADGNPVYIEVTTHEELFNRVTSDIYKSGASVAQIVMVLCNILANIASDNETTKDFVHSMITATLEGKVVINDDGTETMQGPRFS